MADLVKFNRTRPGWLKSKPDFKGYKKGYEPKTKEFREAFSLYKVNVKALDMIRDSDKPTAPRLSSGMKAHRAGTDKLRALDFDPIDALVDQLSEIEALLAAEMEMTAPRIMVINNLTNAKTRILETLLPYRYGKAPIMTIENTDAQQPINIILTHKTE